MSKWKSSLKSFDNGSQTKVVLIMPVAEAKSVRGELGEYQRKYEGEKCTPGESKVSYGVGL